jgi:hypothetical protein
MGKILNAVREDDQVILTVQLDSGSKEKWTYVREEGAYLQVNREDTK